MQGSSTDANYRSETAVGVDLGATQILGGVLDLCTGVLIRNHYRVDTTPHPRTPAEVVAGANHAGPSIGGTV